MPRPGGSPRRPVAPVWRAAAWMALAIGSFLAMAVAVREVSPRIGTFEILLFRSVVGLLVLVPLALRRGAVGLGTARFGLHLARNAVHFAGQFGWTYGLAFLPFAQVFAIEFTMPLWVGVLACLLLGEPLSRTRLVALGLGFAGVLVLIRPGMVAIEPASLVVLGAAACFAGSIVLVKSLVRTESALTILLYMSVVQLPMGLLPALAVWVSPAPGELAWLVLAGLAALSAHYGLARALALADATVVMPLDFLRVPMAAVFGYVLYAEPMEVWTLLGALVVLAANYQLLRAEAREGGAASRATPPRSPH